MLFIRMSLFCEKMLENEYRRSNHESSFATSHSKLEENIEPIKWGEWRF